MINIYEVQDKNDDLINALLEVWEDSVRATHLFLSDEEIQNIKNMFRWDYQKLVI